MEESTDETKGVDTLIMLYDDGYAGFYFMKQNFTKFYGKIVKNMPKKKKNLMEIYNNKLLKFDKRIWTYLTTTFDLDNLKVIILAGPGIAKTRFHDRLKSIDSFEKDKNIREMVSRNKLKFISISTSNTFKSSINEILKSPTASKLLKDTKAMKESQKLEEFF